MQAVQTRKKTAKTNRSRFEITAEILNECLLPQCKTHIMYKDNLSFAQANAYLTMLTTRGLLTRDNGRYETTAKGRQFISAYNQISEIMGTPTSSLTKMKILSSPPTPTNFQPQTYFVRSHTKQATTSTPNSANTRTIPKKTLWTPP